MTSIAGKLSFAEGGGARPRSPETRRCWLARAESSTQGSRSGTFSNRDGVAALGHANCAIREGARPLGSRLAKRRGPPWRVISHWPARTVPRGLAPPPSAPGGRSPGNCHSRRVGVPDPDPGRLDAVRWQGWSHRSGDRGQARSRIAMALPRPVTRTARSENAPDPSGHGTRSGVDSRGSENVPAPLAGRGFRICHGVT